MKTIKRLLPILAAFGVFSCGGGSSGGAGADGAEAGCYAVPEAGASFTWGGGVGPQFVPVFDDASCETPTAGPDPVTLVVVAADETQALERCETGRTTMLPETDPPVAGPSSFFVCD